ncbi:60S ribosomal protein L21-1 [Camellia lanceoleosa]|uniref:60S ribosomal protein L21-1 n=1 Tax=Camellia lanceoleosa TaxID=1840588 RepID=A0ACC0IMQ9_9ERIC|nr:60S ribosomal protein L21-1 [Camellia lanceoleosa]
MFIADSQQQRCSKMLTVADLSLDFSIEAWTWKVGNRIIRKRIHVRIEHVQPSRSTEDFKLRKKKNDKLKAEAKVIGEVISTKRQPEGPKPCFMVEGATLETVTPIPYDVVNDLKGGY